MFLAVCSLSLLLAPLSAIGDGGASISISQKPAEGSSVIGEWTLLRPDQKHVTSNNPTYSADEALSGNYLLNILPPSGMSTKITQTINGEITIVHTPQAPFVLGAGDRASFEIQYTINDFGKVSIDSTPPGFPFTLKGPNDASYRGITPTFYDIMPIGQYSVTLDPIKGCANPRPQSGRLIKDSRVVLSVSLSCDNIVTPQQQKQDKNLKFVEATVDGASVTFEDVPLNQWFSEPIHRSIESKVMSGYRDTSGKATGKFGPEDKVTLAELAKIAHVLAGIDEERGTDEPENLRAKGAWFSRYVASAEQKDWLVFLNRSVDPLRPATRAEVVATLLQALRLSRDWPTGEMFTDVLRTMPYADCIETAAADGLIAGYTDDKEKPSHVFGPTDPVTRAQMAKIVSNAMDLSRKNSSSSSSAKGR